MLSRSPVPKILYYFLSLIRSGTSVSEKVVGYPHKSGGWYGILREKPRVFELRSTGNKIRWISRRLLRYRRVPDVYF